MREIEEEATYGVRVIGSQCYYSQILIGPAELCWRLSGPTVPMTISTTPAPPKRAKKGQKKKKQAKEAETEDNESVWATLKALPILGQLLKDG